MSIYLSPEVPGASPHIADTPNWPVLSFTDTDWAQGGAGSPRSPHGVERVFPQASTLGGTHHRPPGAPSPPMTVTLRETFLQLRAAPSWPGLQPRGSSRQEPPEEGPPSEDRAR